MKRIKNWYEGFKWRDRIIVLTSVLAVMLVIAWQQSFSLINTGLAVAGVMTTLHFILSKSKFPLPALVVIAQIAALAPTFVIYAILSQTLFGETALLFSAFVLSITTLLVFVLAYKFSVGRLWITLLLSYLGLDLVGPFVMYNGGFMNPFIGIVAALFILGLRSILWRDLFRNRKVEIPAEIKNETGTKSIKSLFESMDDVTVQEIDNEAIDFSVTTPANTYYINAVTIRQRIVVTNDNVASGNHNLKSTLFATARGSLRLNKSTKKKVRKNAVPCIVNTTDKTKSKVAVSVSLTGKTRDSGEEVVILSPSSLVNLVKNDLKQVKSV